MYAPAIAGAPQTAAPGSAAAQAPAEETSAVPEIQVAELRLIAEVQMVADWNPVVCPVDPVGDKRSKFGGKLTR